METGRIEIMTEKLRLGITEDAILQTEGRVLTTTDTDDLDSIALFTRGVNRRGYQEQPELFRYLKGANTYLVVHRVITFGYAVALTYDMISQIAREKPLTSNHVAAMHQTLMEHREDSNDLNSPLDLGWFVEKLRSDSPSYAEWLGEVVRDLDDQEDKKDFILGSIIVAMVFYTRADAEILEDTFPRSS